MGEWVAIWFPCEDFNFESIFVNIWLNWTDRVQLSIKCYIVFTNSLAASLDHLEGILLISVMIRVQMQEARMVIR